MTRKLTNAPRDGVFTETQANGETGEKWVYVTPAMARSHPMGRFGGMLWVVAGYFVLVAAVRVSALIAMPGMVSAVTGGLLVLGPLLCAAALALRVPWAQPVVATLSALSVLGAVRGLPAGDPLSVLEVIVLVLIVFYLLEGDRPNLVYRHRYRSFRGDADKPDSDKGM